MKNVRRIEEDFQDDDEPSSKAISDGISETVSAQNKPWAFTVKKLGGRPESVTNEHYCEVVDTFVKFGFIKDIAYERDPSNRLHIHGIVLFRKNFLRKKACLPGFHTKFVEIYDEKPWIEYIHKGRAIDNKQYMF